MRFLRWLLLLVPLATTSCHALWSGPLLYANTSSSAFDMMIALWVFNGIFWWMVVAYCRGWRPA